MKRTLIISSISLLLAVSAQANIYCPTGPAVCIKANNNVTNCYVIGNDGTWTFWSRDMHLPLPNTNYIFPFSLATSRLVGPDYTKSSCVYSNPTDPNQAAAFESNTPLEPSKVGMHGWQPFGPLYVCQTNKPGICPFKRLT